MSNKADFRIGVMYWEPSGGIAPAYLTALSKLGFQYIDTFLYDQKLPKDLDLVIIYGPFGSIVPVTNQLLEIPKDQRPRLVYWMTEQFPDPRFPRWLVLMLGIITSRIEQLSFHRDENGNWKPYALMKSIITRMSRFRYIGHLYWLNKHHLLTQLVTGSEWTANYLKSLNFRPAVATLGWDDIFGQDLGLMRDIPVLWLGKNGTLRRRHLLNKLEDDLLKMDIPILRVDGELNPYVFGDDRTRLINRTKIMINLLRTKWDNHSQRFYLAIVNGALIISEPTYSHTPLQPGVHYIEVEFDQIAKTVEYYLNHEEERNRIVRQARDFMKEHMRSEKAVEKIIRDDLHIEGAF